MDDVYQEFLLEEAASLRNQQQILDFDTVAEHRNASCGDQLKVWVKWNQDTVVDISWEGSGCIISQVGISLLSDAVKGKTKSQIVQMQLNDMLQLLHFDSISPGRLKCLLLGLETIKKAI